jgi:peptidoglycan hydrolase-like protein with peptidoglycan-binding domain
MRRKRFIRSLAAAVAVVFSFSAAPAGAANYFPRDLRLGDEGADVLNLQIALNVLYDSRVADSGPGSPGQETDKFGGLTEAAVIRYQALRGITPADGVVSGETRRALAQTLAWYAEKEGWAEPVPEKATTTKETGQPATIPERIREAGEGAAARRISSVSGAPIVFTHLLSPAEPRKKVTVYGYNYRAGEEYQLIVASTSKPFAKATATSTIAFNFKVPRVKAGVYELYIEGSNGRSETFEFEVGRRSRPVIKSVSPDLIEVGDEVVIQGTGFGRGEITVSTTYGDITGLKAKGGKIKFVSELGADLPKVARPDDATASVPIVLRVKTAKGTSDPFVVYVAF